MAADCKSVRELTLVRIQPFSFKLFGISHIKVDLKSLRFLYLGLIKNFSSNLPHTLSIQKQLSSSNWQREQKNRLKNLRPLTYRGRTHKLSLSPRPARFHLSYRSFNYLSLDQRPPKLRSLLSGDYYWVHSLSKILGDLNFFSTLPPFIPLQNPSWGRPSLKQQQRVVWRFFNFYKSTYFTFLSAFYSAAASKTLLNRVPTYKLNWNFTNHQRLYMTMQNCAQPKYNYFSISLGIFLKFYKNRRPLKRSKLFKLLLVKFVRKLIVLANIKAVKFFIKGVPIFFLELYKALTTPSVHNYSISRTDFPYKVRNLSDPLFTFVVTNYIFLKTKPYGGLKARRRGRVKRKILKRLVKKNAVKD